MSTERGRILEAARKATEGDRNKSYGDPSDQLGLAGMLKEIVRDQMLRDVGPAEMEALDMVLTKLSRAVMGDAPGRDTYVDMAAYAAIAGECAAVWDDERAVDRIRDTIRDAAAERVAVERFLQERDDRGVDRYQERDDGHTVGCYMRGYPSAKCTCYADYRDQEMERDDLTKVDPVVAEGVGAYTGRPYRVHRSGKTSSSEESSKDDPVRGPAGAVTWDDLYGVRKRSSAAPGHGPGEERVQNLLHEWYCPRRDHPNGECNCSASYTRAEREAKAQTRSLARGFSPEPQCECPACSEDGFTHASDCAVHNAPAKENGHCTCQGPPRYVGGASGEVHPGKPVYVRGIGWEHEL